MSAEAGDNCSALPCAKVTVVIAHRHHHHHHHHHHRHHHHHHHQQRPCCRYTRREYHFTAPRAARAPPSVNRGREDAAPPPTTDLVVSPVSTPNVVPPTTPCMLHMRGEGVVACVCHQEAWHEPAGHVGVGRPVHSMSAPEDQEDEEVGQYDVIKVPSPQKPPVSRLRWMFPYCSMETSTSDHRVANMKHQPNKV